MEEIYDKLFLKFSNSSLTEGDLNDLIGLHLSEKDYVFNKGRWAYEHYCSRCTKFVNLCFKDSYLESWQTFFEHSLTNHKGYTLPDLNYRKTIVLLWHFPEYPTFFRLSNSANIMWLIPRDSKWIHAMLHHKNYTNFRDRRNLKEIFNALEKERPIGAMLDFWYPGTSYTDTQFLSYTAKTPSGLLKLAERYDYRIILLTCRNGLFQLVQEYDPQSLDINALAQRITTDIETQILVEPTKWLLWASVDSRWENVDY